MAYFQRNNQSSFNFDSEENSNYEFSSRNDINSNDNSSFDLLNERNIELSELIKQLNIEIETKNQTLTFLSQQQMQDKTTINELKKEINQLKQKISIYQSKAQETNILDNSLITDVYPWYMVYEMNRLFLKDIRELVGFSFRLKNSEKKFICFYNNDTVQLKILENALDNEQKLIENFKDALLYYDDNCKFIKEKNCINVYDRTLAQLKSFIYSYKKDFVAKTVVYGIEFDKARQIIEFLEKIEDYLKIDERNVFEKFLGFKK
jgi:hypothetical protein